MWKTILRRVLLMIPQVIILSILIFMLAKAMPWRSFYRVDQPQPRSSSHRANETGSWFE